jgi:hypothetical protein
MIISADGYADYASASGSTTAVTNSYGTLIDVSAIDNDETT